MRVRQILPQIQEIYKKAKVVWIESSEKSVECIRVKKDIYVYISNKKYNICLGNYYIKGRELADILKIIKTIKR